MDNNIRNITIIAHVDHGKTTMIDALMKQSGSFRENEVIEERLMDSGELEKERGITILAKPASINWQDSRINIIDTPGHRNFAVVEIERPRKIRNHSYSSGPSDVSDFGRDGDCFVIALFGATVSSVGVDRTGTFDGKLNFA